MFSGAWGRAEGWDVDGAPLPVSTAEDSGLGRPEGHTVRQDPDSREAAGSRGSRAERRAGWRAEPEGRSQGQDNGQAGPAVPTASLQDGPPSG